MHATALHSEVGFRRRAAAALDLPWLGTLHEGAIERTVMTLAMAAIPISIAATESFLVIALIVRLFCLSHGDARWAVPRVFRYWLPLAAVEALVWLLSPALRDGWSEIRHLLLVGALFLALPALNKASARVTAWHAVFVSSALGSIFLIGGFVSRLFRHPAEIKAGGDVSFYLRTGGLLKNWMVYGTVEILVVAGLLSVWFVYPEKRRRWWPVMALNAIAVILSLTRTLWVAAFLLLVLQLWRSRSRWLWAMPLLLLASYFLMPSPVRSRIKVSMQPDYFSNAERIQMLQVGWRMVCRHPWLGVGPGRVEMLYRSYLKPSDPVPTYHGHLHNNLAQMAAQFGIPATLVAILFTIGLFRELSIAARNAVCREEKFLCQAGLLSLIGFLAAGVFDYTYGHSLVLILLTFAVLSPLMPEAEVFPANGGSSDPNFSHLRRRR